MKHTKTTVAGVATLTRMTQRIDWRREWNMTTWWRVLAKHCVSNAGDAAFSLEIDGDSEAKYGPANTGPAERDMIEGRCVATMRRSTVC